jgi:hypothetical protein
MKRSTLLLSTPHACVAGLVCLACAAYAPAARADNPVQIEAAGRLGAATSPGWVANPYAFGLGGRVGASAYGFYGGLSAFYYLGDAGFHSLLIGLEAGYTLKLPRVWIRPQLGVGSGTFTETVSDGVSNPPLTTSVGNVYVEPGVVVLVPLGRFFVGADANALIVPHFTLATPDPSAKTYGSFSAHAQVGVFF